VSGLDIASETKIQRFAEQARLSTNSGDLFEISKKAVPAWMLELGAHRCDGKGGRMAALIWRDA
jgi:hypothetical protein